jgi:hypothetical protein
MRDFRDAKAMAQTVRAALAAKGVKITISESLELIAKAVGAPDWNTLSAAIKAAEVERGSSQPLSSDRAVDELARLARALGPEDRDKVIAMIRAARPFSSSADDLQARELPDPIPQPAARSGLSAALEATLHRAVGLATARKHSSTTLEHLLLALIEDADAAEVMRACKVDLGDLGKTLIAFIDSDLKSLVVGDGEDPAPTGGFQRVIQRAVIHVRSSGREGFDVTGANVLVAIFSERESHAAYFLGRQGMTRYDAVSFLARGVRRDGGRAA